MPIHYAQDGHPPSQGWSPTVQNLPKGSVLQTWNFTQGLSSQNDQMKWDGQPPSPRWSPNNQSMVTHQPKLIRSYKILKISNQTRSLTIAQPSLFFKMFLNSFFCTLSRLSVFCWVHLFTCSPLTKNNSDLQMVWKISSRGGNHALSALV